MDDKPDSPTSSAGRNPFRRLIMAVLDKTPYIGRLRKQISIDSEKIRTLFTEANKATLSHAAELSKFRSLYGKTFEELEIAGRVGKGTLYKFEYLLGLINEPQDTPPVVPPAVFLYVPKCGGNTVNRVLRKNYKRFFFPHGDAFFPRYSPEEFVNILQPRRSGELPVTASFSGHIDINNDVLRYMPVNYVAFTMLRDPVQRIISHYRFHATLPDNPLGIAINEKKLDPKAYFCRYQEAILQQYEVFAPRTLEDSSEPERVEKALRNLEERVSLFGLIEQSDEFMVQLAELLGLPDIRYGYPQNKSPDYAPIVTTEQEEELRELLKHDIAFYEGAVVLYKRRCASLPFDCANLVEDFRKSNAAYRKRSMDSNPLLHPWQRFYF